MRVARLSEPPSAENLIVRLRHGCSARQRSDRDGQSPPTGELVTVELAGLVQPARPDVFRIIWRQ